MMMENHGQPNGARAHIEAQCFGHRDGNVEA